MNQLKPYRLDLVLGDEVLISSYSDQPPFVPRKSDVIVKGLDKYNVLEVQITYLFPIGMNFVVYLEGI